MSADNLNWKEYNENETAKALNKNAESALRLMTVNQLRCACMTISDDVYGKLLELLKNNPEALELLDMMDHMQFIHHCGDTVSLSEIEMAKEMIFKFYSPHKTKSKKQNDG